MTIKTQIMCLIITDKFSEPLVATKAIRCYKVIYRHICTGQLRSPFMDSLIVFTSRLTARLSFSMSGDIERGYHVFTTKAEAKKFCDKEKICFVIPAILPKGSRYYRGRFDCSYGELNNKFIYDSLASDQIIYYSKWWIKRLFQGYYFQ